MKIFEDELVNNAIDIVGFVLLVIWVGALQIMLDEGKDFDWFASEEIWVLAIVACIGFLCFCIWELTADHPIVDISVFRHRGFSASMFVLALAFGCFFGLNVLTPLWLQYNLGYTTTWAGIVVAWGGLLQVVFSPVSGHRMRICSATFTKFVAAMAATIQPSARRLTVNAVAYPSVIMTCSGASDGTSATAIKAPDS